MRHLSIVAVPLLLIARSSVAMSAEAASPSCPITSAKGGFYRNEALQAQLPADGKFVFQPGGPGFVDRDGALGIKFPWDRLIPGELSVGGRRLDGAAGPARAYISDG